MPTNTRRARGIRFREQIANSPRYHDVKADLWQVRITIRMRLLTDLNEANYWNEHSQIPKPRVTR